MQIANNYAADKKNSELTTQEQIWETHLNLIGMDGDIDILEKHLMSAPNRNSDKANMLALRLMHRTCLS